MCLADDFRRMIDGEYDLETFLKLIYVYCCKKQLSQCWEFRTIKAMHFYIPNTEISCVNNNIYFLVLV